MVSSTRSPIESVGQFVERVMTWTRDNLRPVAFRGQSFAKWRTIPKIFRPEIGLYDHEKNAVRDLIAVHPQEFRDDVTMFDRLVRMQHFDLPTRLLDVTTNPLVALFFALDEHRENGAPEDGKVQGFFLPPVRQRYYDSDRVSCLANLSNLTTEEKGKLFLAAKSDKAKFNKHPSLDRLLWFIRIEKPHFKAKIIPSDLILPVYVKPKMSNRRIVAQSGAFIIYGPLQLTTNRRDKGLLVSRILISAAHKGEIRRQLERLGIHASALFPEIDKAAKFIAQKHTAQKL